jgi:hypothetical protein
VAASADGAPVWHVRHVFEHEPTAALVADFFRAHGVSYAKNVLQPTLRALAKEAKALEVRIACAAPTTPYRLIRSSLSHFLSLSLSLSLCVRVCM